MFDYSNSAALVTGASRGIGAAIANELAARGIRHLALVARSKDDLETLATEIFSKHETSVEVITANLSDEDAPAAVKAETDRRGLTVDLLVNNAGFGSHGFFEQLPAEKERDMVAVNVAALVALTRLYLPDMVERGRGGVLNVGSTAGFQPVPYMATYGATKAFVQSFSEALWAENRDRGNDVRVVCLCPGGTETNFGAVVGNERGRFESLPPSTPQEVAKAGLDALDRGAPFVVVGAMNYAGTLLPRLFPRATVARISGSLFRPRAAGERGPSRIPRGLLIGTGTLAAGLVASGVVLNAYWRRKSPGT
jgi:short-subunit dehydrogenase